MMSKTAVAHEPTDQPQAIEQLSATLRARKALTPERRKFLVG